MEPAITLEYRTEADLRPRWISRLAITSIILGTFDAMVSVLRIRTVGRVLFATVFSRRPFSYVSPRWVYECYLIAMLAAAALSIMLIFVAAKALAKSQTAYRGYLVYAISMILLTIFTVMLVASHSIAHSSFSVITMTRIFLAQVPIFGVYPVFVLFFILHKMRRQRRDLPAA